MNIKNQIQNFLQGIILIDKELERCYYDEDERREHISGMLYAFLSSNLYALSLHNNPEGKALVADMFGKDEINAIDDMLKAVMIDYKYVYDNFIDDAVSDLLDFMIDIVDKETISD